MTGMFDLSSATSRMDRVLDGINDEHLHAATPCTEATVGMLVDHVLGLTLAFTAAASKDFEGLTDAPPALPTGELQDDWNDVATARLSALADAWRNPDAWTGTTRAGGIDLPGEVAGLVALDELVVHGWDLAVATGQPYACEPEEIAACLAFAGSVSDEQRTEGALFGPAVAVPGDAPALHRLLGLTGRDPSWAPAG
ncbi:TIGR03086 family metal-binding protein [Rhodococcus coprophilus]|uniref:TIGR03086 family metal-binding protein n=1 Tax=Rhodococcus coprophilus TaxID=38310 RepID=UPI0033FCAE78